MLLFCITTGCFRKTGVKPILNDYATCLKTSKKMVEDRRSSHQKGELSIVLYWVAPGLETLGVTVNPDFVERFGLQGLVNL